MTPADIAYIESQAYPSFMCGMEGVETWEDVADYCEAKVPALQVYGKAGHWYALVIVRKKRVYVADLACVPGKVPPIWTIIRTLLGLANGRPVYCDARDTTSFPLIKRLADRGRIKCTILDTWCWGGETMHECKITGV